MPANVYRKLRENFPDPQRTCIRQATGERISYGDVDRRTAELAAFLRAQGVKSGQIVALLIDKSAEGILLYLALCRIGAVFLPIHTGLATAEIRLLLKDAEPRLVICDPRFAGMLLEEGNRFLTLDGHGKGELAHRSADATPDDALASLVPGAPNALVYTSGTTGRPKGAWITCNQINWNVAAIGEMWEITDKDVLLHLNLMAFGIFATTLPIVNAGACIHLVRDASIDTILAALPEATMMATVPTVYQRLVADQRFDPRLCADMRLFITGSAPMREDLFEAFHARTGHRLLDRYGMTEALLITSNRASEFRVAGNSGYPLPGSQIRIMGEDGVLGHGEIGQIQVKQPAPFTGYLGAPDKTAESFTDDGWLITGDFGRLDSEGRLSVFGRGTDLIITGGLNVYPKEVEQALNQIEGIRESAVIGVPHPEYGEAVFAVIEIADEAENDIRAADLSVLLRGSIAGYKVPKHIEIVPQLPRNALEKIKKQELRKRFVSHFQIAGNPDI